MMRKFKKHEKKLLKKADFLKYREETKSHEDQVIRNYYLQNREDYKKYNRLTGEVTSIVHHLRYLKASSKVRMQVTRQLLDKLHSMGVIEQKETLSGVDKLSTASFCKRRLPVVLMGLQMAQTLEMAVRLVEQGHIRVGPHQVSDPAFLVPRALEDHVTWMNQSKRKEAIAKYNRQLDDYTMAND
ncbi:U3 small nucleolar ribonucleoprotein IMP3 [Diplonema papillatum]|nr:U3 small nucleolar ribonucleoprotein IMP3 [Diplonema papillatum]